MRICKNVATRITDDGIHFRNINTHCRNKASRGSDYCLRHKHIHNSRHKAKGIKRGV